MSQTGPQAEVRVRYYRTRVFIRTQNRRGDENVGWSGKFSKLLFHRIYNRKRAFISTQQKVVGWGVEVKGIIIERNKKKVERVSVSSGNTTREYDKVSLAGLFGNDCKMGFMLR
jgi:hypothetical protein